MQADLGYYARLYAIATQGRDGEWGGGDEEDWNQYVASYNVKYSPYGTGDTWEDYIENGEVKVWLECNTIYTKSSQKLCYYEDSSIQEKVTHTVPNT